MLGVEGLSVRYGGVQALRGVSLHVAEGEVVALLGPNGAGKTSLLGAIAGLAPVQSGDVSLSGQSLVGLAPEKVVRRGVALVREGRHIFTGMTVAENLRLAALACPDRALRARTTEHVLRLFPVLEEFRDRKGGLLSGGQQQQLAIGRALLSRPRLLMLDEPSLGLAPVVVDTVFETIDRLRREDGVTVLLVEQHAARALRLADRTYVLSGGQVVAEGGRDELDADQVATTYLGAAIP